MNLWFTEEDPAGIRVSYRVKEVLFREQSEFQLIEVIETEAYGRMLVIDGFVMTTDADEFVYHEMITHVPLCLHKNPENILVIGGGDGGTVREVLRHDCVKKVTLCEIDGKVIDACRQFFPQISCRLDDPKCEVMVGDGIGYIAEHESSFDVVIVDSTDPVGPGEGLFTDEFYRNVARSLKPGGVMVAQSESAWYRAEDLQRIQKNIGAGFAHIKPYIGSVPTYPRGLWSWTMASNLAILPKDFNRQRLGDVSADLKYLTAENFSSAFALPPFVSKKFF